jgi:hypothetical protein
MAEAFSVDSDFNGGSINQPKGEHAGHFCAWRIHQRHGPFEPGALVSVPDEIGNHLLGTGAVTPVLPASKKPISFSLNVKFDNKEPTDV